MADTPGGSGELPAPSPHSPATQQALGPMLPPAPREPEPAWVPDLPEHAAEFGPSGPGDPLVVPPPPARTGPTRAGSGGPVSSMRARSVLAQLGLVGAMAGSVAFGYAVWRQRSVLVDLRDGLDVTEAEATDVDALVGQAMWSYLGAVVVCAVLFVVWFHRAYKNLHAYRRTDFRTHWPVVAWLIPILNLWRPLQIANELASKSPMQRRDQAPGFVVLWWLAFIASGVVSRLASGLTRSDASVDSEILARTLLVVTVPIQLTGAVCGLMLVRFVTNAQRPFVTS